MSAPRDPTAEVTADADLVAKIDHLVVVTLEGSRPGPVDAFLAQNFASGERRTPAAADPWANRVEALTGQPSGVNGPVGPSTELLPHTATMLDRLDERRRTWRAYRGDASVLWAMRRTYRPTMAYGAMHFDTVSNFFEDARSGDLSAVSWIEPRYVGFADPWARADHEQSLVGRVYETIRGAPLEAWYRTLLVVMRCDPGPWPIAGEGAAGEAPSASTIVVSPWTEQGAVSDKALGPASLVSTALQRFCPDPRHFADVGPTVAAATHYGHLLTRATPRSTPSIVPTPARSAAAGEGESPAVPAAIRAFREEMRMLHERFGRP